MVLAHIAHIVGDGGTHQVLRPDANGARSMDSYSGLMSAALGQILGDFRRVLL